MSDGCLLLQQSRFDPFFCIFDNCPLFFLHVPSRPRSSPSRPGASASLGRSEVTGHEHQTLTKTNGCPPLSPLVAMTLWNRPGKRRNQQRNQVVASTPAK